jgi:hypothetical protein
VPRILQILEEEFPGYHHHPESLLEAAVALTAVLGAVGAHALLDGGQARFDKMMKMVTLNAEQFASRAANVIKDKRSKMS